jgi:hypothetical protein
MWPSTQRSTCASSAPSSATARHCGGTAASSLASEVQATLSTAKLRISLATAAAGWATMSAISWPGERQGAAAAGRGGMVRPSASAAPGAGPCARQPCLPAATTLAPAGSAPTAMGPVAGQGRGRPPMLSSTDATASPACWHMTISCCPSALGSARSWPVTMAMRRAAHHSPVSAHSLPACSSRGPSSSRTTQAAHPPGTASARAAASSSSSSNSSSSSSGS